MNSRTYPPIAWHELASMDSAQRDELLRRAEDDLDSYIEGVRPIIESVRLEGDEALARLAQKFDKAALSAKDIESSRKDMDAAFDLLEPDMIEVLEYSADNIRRFHEAQLPQDTWEMEIETGVRVGERYTPIDSVACYSPRGKGSFPVVTLMTAIPATVAKVPDVIVLTPSGPDGKVDPATLVAARLSGVERVFKVGGSQAVAAAAYGTESVPRCRKIVGPGNPWLAAAKRVLAGVIDPGLAAGPSETIVFADSSANAEVVALDMLIESEHGDDSSSFLVTTDAMLAKAVVAAIPKHWDNMSETLSGYSSSVLSGTSGGVVLAEDLPSAYDFINDYAPEHLQILSKQPDVHLDHIRNASEILLGEYAAGTLANYMMGPNCVLPTSGAAHTCSPLGVHDFLKSASIGRVNAQGFAKLAPRVHKFATYEGFDGHANAVSSLRSDALNSENS